MCVSGGFCPNVILLVRTILDDFGLVSRDLNEKKSKRAECFLFIAGVKVWVWFQCSCRCSAAASIIMTTERPYED